MPSLSVSVSGGKAAVGGTISVIVAGSRTIADVLAGAELISAGAAAISAVAKDKFVSALGSVSAAPSGSGAVAAAVNVLVATAETRAKVGNGATVSAAGNVCAWHVCLRSFKGGSRRKRNRKRIEPHDRSEPWQGRKADCNRWQRPRAGIGRRLGAHHRLCNGRGRYSRHCGRAPGHGEQQHGSRRRASISLQAHSAWATLRA